MPIIETEKKSLILLRGLPGSGKSTLARVLAENGMYPVFSIDSYFTDAEGIYHFEFDKNYIAYKNCEDLTRAAMQRGCAKIFVDNTFTLSWELEPYFNMATTFNYRVFAVTVENRHGSKNIHHISDEQVEKMAAKYTVQLK